MVIHFKEHMTKKHVLRTLLLATALLHSADSAMSEEKESFLKTLSEHVTLSGLLEAEAFSGSDFADEDSSDIALATMQLGIDVQATDLISGHILFLYEEDSTEPMDVDEASITIGGTEDTPALLSVGKMYLPFGVFDSNMISDPLTLEIAETSQTALQVGYKKDAFYGSIYAFNCDTQEEGDDQIECFGANVGTSHESDSMTVALEAGYISNLADSDAFDSETGVVDYAGGYSLSANLGFGDFNVIGEYISALDDIEYIGGSSFEPSAYMVEAAYNFKIKDMDSVFAIGYQSTDEMAGVLPETRILGSVGTNFTENLSGALEISFDEDYSLADGGTDEDAQTITAQVALSF